MAAAGDLVGVVPHGLVEDDEEEDQPDDDPEEPVGDQPGAGVVELRVLGPDVGADDEPVDGEEEAEEDGDGEGAEDVPVDHVREDELPDLVAVDFDHVRAADNVPARRSLSSIFPSRTSLFSFFSLKMSSAIN